MKGLKPLRWTRHYWATVESDRGMPCLWGKRRHEASEGAMVPSERVVLVRVTVVRDPTRETKRR